VGGREISRNLTNQTKKAILGGGMDILWNFTSHMQSINSDE